MAEKKKKVLLLSTSDVNGAYEAIYRIATYLLEDGYEVAMVVRNKTKADKFIYEVAYQQPALPVRFRNKIYNSVSGRNAPKDPKYLFLDEDERIVYTSTQQILKAIPFVPDLVISGMTDRFINTQNLLDIKQQTDATIYLLTVDMAPVTGGCHFSWGCKAYEESCNNCPAAQNEAAVKWVRENFAAKKKNIAAGNMNVLAGSGWTLMQAQGAALYRHQQQKPNVSGCVDTRVFTNKNRATAKSIFGIDDNLKLIFCGSQSVHDPRKGFAYFLDALDILYKNLTGSQREAVCILVIGRSTNPEILSRIPFKTHIIDYITDYRLLALAYQASDIFVCASIEDSGPLMVSEALASGTPVVGFEMGIVYDMVISGYNGYKAELKNAADMAKGLAAILSLSAEAFTDYSKNARKLAEEKASYKTALNTLKQL